ncbi:MAG TPA: hypothetical protein VIW80_21645 [Pyrinomonadaceae bacterium]
MTSDFTLLERVTRVAPLGVRFHDAVTGTQVSDGLVVEAYSKAAASGRRRARDEVRGRRRAFANRSGVHVLMNVPGLLRFEMGEVAEELWEMSPPGAEPFIIEVEDTLRRYLPFSFETRLPFKGLFVWEENPLPPESPLAAQTPDGLPLFSAPARPTPVGMASIRAELWDETTNEPAAYAMLEARFKGQLLGRGVADENGRLLLIVPYPPPAKLPQASPLGGPTSGSGAIPPLTEQEWLIDLTARYGPNGSPPSPAQKFPDIFTVLSQRKAVLWQDAERTQQLTTAPLKFGRECFVRTEVMSPVTSPVEGAPLAALFITPAA